MITDNMEYVFENGELLLTYEELAEWSEGDVVSVSGDTGVVTAVMTSNFKFPTGEDEERDIEASSDSPVYIVAVESGAIAASEDELEDDSFDGEEDVDPKKLESEAEMSDAFKEENIEELLSVSGPDLRSGFDKLPEGWDRTTVLKAWASLGGTWTSCRAEMTGDISRPKAFCAAFKTEVVGKGWRGKF